MSHLTFEDKINLYNYKKNGMPIGNLSNKYNVRKCVINYLTVLIYKHKIDILRINKNKLHMFMKGRINNRKKVNVVSKLRLKYSLMILLQLSGLAKLVYYYTLSKTDEDNKNIFKNTLTLELNIILIKKSIRKYVIKQNKRGYGSQNTIMHSNKGIIYSSIEFSQVHKDYII